MAKVTGPLMSLTASGKLGKSIVFMKWRGISDVRKWLIPANPKTTDQQRVRNDFKSAVNKYHTLDGSDMAALRIMTQSKPYSGFNQWVGWIRNATELTKTWVTIKKVSTGTPTSTGTTVKATPDKAGVLKVFVGTTAGSWTQSFEETEPGGEANEEHSITLTGLTPKTKYWCTVQYPEASNSYGYTGWFTFTTEET